MGQSVLVSSGKKEEVEQYKRIASITDLVDHETSSGDAKRSKPHPDVYCVALSALGNVRPSEVIVVGDSPHDAEAARKAGLTTVGVLCGGFGESVLRNAGCIALYKDPEDLLHHYDDSPLVGIPARRHVDRHAAVFRRARRTKARRTLPYRQLGVLALAGAIVLLVRKISSSGPAERSATDDERKGSRAIGVDSEGQQTDKRKDAL